MTHDEYTWRLRFYKKEEVEILNNGQSYRLEWFFSVIQEDMARYRYPSLRGTLLMKVSLDSSLFSTNEIISLDPECVLTQPSEIQARALWQTCFKVH